jgi:hypothetical protein
MQQLFTAHNAANDAPIRRTMNLHGLSLTSPRLRRLFHPGAFAGWLDKLGNQAHDFRNEQLAEIAMDFRLVRGGGVGIYERFDNVPSLRFVARQTRTLYVSLSEGRLGRDL